MFLRRRGLDEDEMKYYQEMYDPSRNMNDDVFRELCCIENVDLEYVAMDKNDRLKDNEMNGKSLDCPMRQFISMFPAYISLFGSMEMRIVINQDELRERIMGAVLRYCVKKT